MVCVQTRNGDRAEPNDKGHLASRRRRRIPRRVAIGAAQALQGFQPPPCDPPVDVSIRTARQAVPARLADVSHDTLTQGSAAFEEANSPSTPSKLHPYRRRRILYRRQQYLGFWRLMRFWGQGASSLYLAGGSGRDS